MFITLLSSRQELAFKNKVGVSIDYIRELFYSLLNQLLDLLPFFCIATENHEKIKSALERLVTQHFPLTSHEFELGSSSSCVYSQSISKLLTAMQDSGAIIVSVVAVVIDCLLFADCYLPFQLLKIVVTILCREKDHVMKDEIQSAIENTIARFAVFRDAKV